MLMAAKRMGGKSISRAKKSHDFREVTAAKRKKRDGVATRPTKSLRLVDFLTSEGIVNLPPSGFLESLRLGSRQQLADAGTHAMRNAGNSTAWSHGSSLRVARIVGG